MKNHCYTVWFEDFDLLARYGKSLHALPQLFTIANLFVGCPRLVEAWDSIPHWEGFKMPADPFTLYVFRRDPSGKYPAGAAHYSRDGSRAGVAVRPDDHPDVIFLRIWHELLHTMDLDADGMKDRVKEWLPKINRIPYLFHLYYRDVDIPYWHRQYYQWVTENMIQDIKAP